MIALMLVTVVVIAWRVARRRRQTTLAGLDATRPTYSVPPPRRRLGNLNSERL